MRRFIPPGLALIYSALPLFPSFIALTGVAFPGVSLLPIPATLAVLGGCCVLAVYALVMLVRYPLRGAAAAVAAVALDLRCGLARRMLGLRSALRSALHLHRRPRHHLALLDHALLRRSLRSSNALLRVSALGRHRGGGCDRDGGSARTAGTLRAAARPRDRHVHPARRARRVSDRAPAGSIRRGARCESSPRFEGSRGSFSASGSSRWR